MADQLRENIRAYLLRQVYLQEDHATEMADAILSLLREEGVDLEGWRPIESAPKDGTAIIAYCVHANSKYATNSIQEGWEYPVIAKWIDHNGGGWTWHGMAGTFTHWRPLPKGPADE